MSLRHLLRALTLLLLPFECLGAQAPEPKGVLVIAGGGKLPEEILDAFVSASGGKDAVIGLVPTSTSEPEVFYREWKERLEKRGARFRRFDIRHRAEASLPAKLKAAEACTGFWFSGGDQNRTGDKLIGTEIHKTILRRYTEGAALGGTSAGAAIMSRIMLTGDDCHAKEKVKESWTEGRWDTAPGCYSTREGLGALRGCIVDQHFLVRTRHNRLISLIMAHPDHLGLGVDEETALVVKDGKARVIGNRHVLVLDPMAMSTDVGTFRDLRVHLLGRGQVIDLATRKVETAPVP
jgi:cyanophycinase